MGHVETQQRPTRRNEQQNPAAEPPQLWTPLCRSSHQSRLPKLWRSHPREDPLKWQERLLNYTSARFNQRMAGESSVSKTSPRLRGLLRTRAGFWINVIPEVVTHPMADRRWPIPPVRITDTRVSTVEVRRLRLSAATSFPSPSSYRCVRSPTSVCLRGRATANTYEFSFLGCRR